MYPNADTYRMIEEEKREEDEGGEWKIEEKERRREDDRSEKGIDGNRRRRKGKEEKSIV